MRTTSSTSSKSLPRKTTDPARARTRPEIKVILCDLGNVLVNFDHRIAVRRIRKFTKLPFRDIYAIFFDSPLTKDFEEGRIDGRAFFGGLQKELGLDGLTFQRFVPVWNGIFSDNKGIVDVLRALKEKYRLHLVSNINRLHYDHVARRFPDHVGLFDAVYLSCDVGRRKPHPAIYRRAVEEHGFRLRDALYADDRPDLVRAAAKMGLKGIVFKDVRDFRKRLRRLRVLP